jgi:hypothetical protein
MNAQVRLAVGLSLLFTATSQVVSRASNTDDAADFVCTEDSTDPLTR